MSRRSFTELLHRFDRWGFDEKGWSANTRDRRIQTWRRAEAHFQHHYDKSLIWATQDQLKQFLFSAPPSARTRNNLRAHLIGIFSFIEAEGIRENIARGLPRIREERSLPKAPENHQVHRIIQTSKTHPPMITALIHLFAYQGIRLTEARTLRWDHLEGNWLRIHGKGNKTRIIPLHAETSLMLAKWKAEGERSPWIFPSPRDPERPISDTYIKTVVRLVAVEAGIRGFHAHLFRHAYATRLIEQGADLRTVQELLGHASPTTTSIYTRIRPHQLNQALDLSYQEEE